MVHIYPYSHMNEVNLDWILQTMHDLEVRVDAIDPGTTDRVRALINLFGVGGMPQSGIAVYKDMAGFGLTESFPIITVLALMHQNTAIAVRIAAGDVVNLTDKPEADGLLIAIKREESNIRPIAVFIGTSGKIYTMAADYSWIRPTLDIAHGGTGATTAAAARSALGAEPARSASSPLPITSGGTGASTAAAARSALGAEPARSASSPLPISSGGTGASTAAAALAALGGLDVDALVMDRLTDPNTATAALAVVNGWSSSRQNVPTGFSNANGILVTVWYYKTTIGNLSASRTQILLSTKGRWIRGYETSWGAWETM